MRERERERKRKREKTERKKLKKYEQLVVQAKEKTKI